MHINLLGKIFLTTLSAWLVGKIVNTKIRGDRRQIEALAKAMIASKRFQQELLIPGATMDSIMNKLDVKNMTVAKFEKTFGMPWPL